MNTMILIAIAVNTAFFSAFASRYYKLRRDIKRHSYKSGLFRGIDELKREQFLKLTILGAFNLVVLTVMLYEINN